MVAAAPLLGLALTVGAGAMQYSAAQSANRARERATQQWLKYQKTKRTAQQMKDEENRKKAEAARQGGVDKLGMMPEDVGTETQRLNTDLNAGNTMAAAPEATVNDNLLSGQGDNPSFKVYAAKQLNRAAKDARNKTAALAAISAYTGSQHGLQNTNAKALSEAQQGIDFYNNYRRGDLSTYGLAQNIQPLQVNVGSGGGIGDALASIGGTMMGGGLGGGGLSSIF